MKQTISCQYRETRPKLTALCSLGLYGGKVTDGVCKRCVSLGQNNAEYARELFEKSKRSHPEGAARISGCCDRADQA